MVREGGLNEIFSRIPTLVHSDGSDNKKEAY